MSLRKQDTSRRGKGGKNRHSCRITDPQFKISDHQFIAGFALVLRCVAVITGTSVCPQSPLGPAAKVKSGFIFYLDMRICDRSLI